MRKLLIVFFLFLTKFLYSQPNIQWQKNYGGSSSENVYAVKQTTDGGYIMVGGSSSINGDIDDHHGTTSGLEDYWVVKTNSTGTIEWKKSYGGSLSDRATDITLTSDGGYAIVGYSNSIDGDIISNITNPGNRGGSDIWVIKITSTGTLQGVRRNFGGSSEDRAYSIKQTNDGGFVIAGSTNSNDGNLTGMWSQAHTRGAWVIKLAYAGTTGIGDIVWQKIYGGINYQDEFTSVSILNDNSIILGGNAGYSVFSQPYQSDFFIVKLSSTGTEIWQKNYGSNSNDDMNDIKPTSDGGFIAVGSVGANDGNVTGNHGGNDYWIVKLNSTGTLLWQKCFGGTLDDGANSVIEYPNGIYTIFGSSSSSNGDITANLGLSDFWLININSTGSLIWQKSFGGVLTDAGACVIINSSNELVVLGTSSSNIVGNYGQTDYYLAKFNSSVVPITFGIFNGQLLNGNAYLFWETLFESNISSFFVQKSTDGINFSNIGVVSARNAGNFKSAYSFIDSSFTSKAFYRIKAFEKDGGMKFSQITLINKSTSFTVYPNPVSNILNIEFPNNQIGKKAIITIHDYLGRQVYKKSITVKSLISINTKQFSNMQVGTYIITVTDEYSNNQSKKILIR